MMKPGLFFVIVLVVFVCQSVLSKEKNGTHNFKIVGKTRITLSSPQGGEKMAEYVKDSANHILITSFDKDGRITSGRRFLFTGKTFDLSAEFTRYLEKKEIIADGLSNFYRKDGKPHSNQLFKEGVVVERSMYYPDGKIKSRIEGMNDILNGEYKIWHPNGQINFVGNYIKNKKDGVFEMYDEAGLLIKKGIYKEGMLRSDEPVVPDIIYSNPEVPAAFCSGETAFNEYLTRKATGIEVSKVFPVRKRMRLDLVIDNDGKLGAVQIGRKATPTEALFINAIFKDCPNICPASVEGIKVRSTLKTMVSISPQEVSIETMKTFEKVDKMPEFPGGTEALRHYVANSIRYPLDAQAAGIQGRVFVNFIINETGNIEEVTIAKGLSVSLDLEAMRVVSEIPRFIPGESNGIPVRVSYTLPINFNLK